MANKEKRTRFDAGTLRLLLGFRSTCELLSKKHVVRRYDFGKRIRRNEKDRKWVREEQLQVGITQERGQTAGR